MINRFIVFLFSLLLLSTGYFSPLYAQENSSRGLGLQKKAGATTAHINKGSYRALIIGNNNYRDREGQWKSLKTAIADARAVTRLLQSQYGFNDIELIEDASRREVLQAFNRLSRKVQAQDSVLVYYAGHGYMESETQKGFWIPVDAQGKDNTTFLRNSTIRDELTTIASRAKHTLLVSDSCFSGSLLRRGNRGIQVKPDNLQYYKKVANKKSVQIMAAGGLEYVDDQYRSSVHSPFTYFFLNELKNNDRPMLTMSELSTNVEKAVANNVDQIPESGVLQGAGDELGEFIFIKMDVEVQGVPLDRVKVKVNLKQGSKSRVSDTQVETQPVKTQTRPEKDKPILPVPTL